MTTESTQAANFFFLGRWGSGRVPSPPGSGLQAPKHHQRVKCSREWYQTLQDLVLDFSDIIRTDPVSMTFMTNISSAD